jgi:branched-chain amino acid transport system substrate-binding protein
MTTSLPILVSALCLSMTLFTPASMAEDSRAGFSIGFVGPTTGSAAATGAAFREGIDLALDVLKQKGGDHAKVSVILEDTSGVPEKAAAAFEKLATKEKVSMIVGESHSSCALAEIELAERYQVPFMVIEAWADSILEKNYPMVFREGPSNSAVVKNTLARFITGKDGGTPFKNIVIVAENSDWGKGISALTTKALDEAKTPYQLVQIDNKAKDFYNELNQLKQKKPDLVVAFIYSFALHTFIAQAKEVGVTPSALILDGAGTPSLWPEFWNNVKDAGEKELFLSSIHESVQPTAEAKAFWSRYQKKYGKAPSDYKSRSAYTAVLLAADAIVATARKKKAFTGPDLVQTLEGIRFQAPTGTVQFGAKKGEPNYHQWNPPMLIGQWQDRKQVIVFPTKIATGKIRK